jgi:hypothetical protein
MNGIKNILILALVGLNLGLLAGLIHVNLRSASAQQTPWPKTDYIVQTGHISKNDDGLYIIDVSTRRWAAWKFNQEAERLQPISRGRYLERDFSR